MDKSFSFIKSCVLSANGNNNDANSTDIIFTIKDTKLYVPIVTLSAKTTKSNKDFLAKDLKDLCIGIDIKQKVTIKTQQTNKDIFLNNRLFGLICLFQSR